ncbi:glycosyltransferase [Enterococcus hulanensis]|nr:glycosyltransferase [Enterococcus hulanensis]MBO0412383.1 glycosyltransferase [Enterococcus hulanensis]
MKKKILIVTQSEGGGLRRHLVELLKNIDQNKFDLYFMFNSKNADTIFLNEMDELSEYTELIDIPTFVREINFKSDLKTYRFISKWIKKNNPDIVHAHSSKAGVIARLAAKRHGIKKIFYTPHAYSFLAPEFSNNKKKLFIIIERILSKYATNQTFAVSVGEQKKALQYKIDSIDKIKVIYNGLPTVKLPTKEEARRILSLPEDAFIIGNNARLTTQKNPLAFVEVAKQVVLEKPSSIFVWIGDGPLEYSVKAKVKEYNLEKNVRFYGFRKDSDIIVVAYDLFLFTSLYEGLPYAPLEALRAKVPVIATNVTGNCEVIDNKVTGHLVSNDMVNEAAKIIIDAINGENSITPETIEKNFEKKFSINTMIKKIEKNYCEE